MENIGIGTGNVVIEIKIVKNGDQRRNLEIETGTKKGDFFFMHKSRLKFYLFMEVKTFNYYQKSQIVNANK